ncbi:unannotated protein [freshwater metagenome]|uniref:Unannotated protein n=1 Tax=freshwater metagenome TaxID=449393 RepID=A0A6J7H762_9ZZZZ|nr:hypothetical protein [Actinomycetota bacterium]
MTSSPASDMRKPATLVHTSDCHLDKTLDGPEQQAFSSVVDLAIKRDADALLIAGDLFDHNRVKPEIVHWVASELNRYSGPVVLLVGNHDVFHESSVHNKHDLRDLYEHLYMLDQPDGSIFDLPGTEISVWGRAMVEHAPEFQPLLNAPKARPDKWNVIAAHGLVNAEAGRSSPIYTHELNELSADYVALGHVHVHSVVHENPLTMYSGAPYHWGSDKTGCIIVDFVPNEPVQAEWTSLKE